MGQQASFGERIRQLVAAIAVCAVAEMTILVLARALGGGVDDLAADLLTGAARTIGAGLSAAGDTVQPVNPALDALKVGLETSGEFFQTSALVQYAIPPLILGQILARFGVFRTAIARWTGAYPAFLKPVPSEGRAWRGEARETSGATNEILTALARFAEGDRRRFQGLRGPDEIANREVAHVWLRRLQRANWDVGVCSLFQIPLDWLPARPTAIFIEDHIGGVDELREHLVRLKPLIEKSQGARLRVLFSASVDFGWLIARREPALHAAMSIYAGPAAGTSRSNRSARAASVSRGGLSETAGTPDIEDQGRRDGPFLAVTVRNPAAAAAEFVDHACDLFGADGAALACLAAVCGPVSHQAVAALAPAASDQRKLAELFPNAASDLDLFIPAIDGGFEIEAAVRALERLSRYHRERFAERLLAEHPEAAEDVALMMQTWRRRMRAEVRAAGSMDQRPARDEAARAAARACLADLRGLVFARYPQTMIAELMGDDETAFWSGVLGRFLQYDELRAREIVTEATGLGAAWIGAVSGEGRTGRLLALLAAPAAGRLKVEPYADVASILHATVADRLGTVPADARQDRLRFVLETESDKPVSEDLALLLESPVWRLARTDVFESVAAFLMNLDGAGEGLDRIATVGTPGVAGSSDLDDETQAGLRALRLVEAAFQASSSEESDVWAKRLSEVEPTLAALLESEDPFSRSAAVWALFWVAKAASLHAPLASMSEPLVARLGRIVEDPATPSPAWRRAAWTLAKLLGRPGPEDTVLKWVEAIERPAGEPSPPPPRPPELDGGPGVAAETSRRLMVGSRRERIAAAALQISLGKGDPDAAEVLAGAMRESATDPDYQELLAVLLAHASGPHLVITATRTAISGRGLAQTLALLTLHRIAAGRELERVVQSIGGRAAALHRRCFEGLVGADLLAETFGAAPSSAPSLMGLVAKRRTVMVLLVRGEDPQGAPIFAYVGVRADRLEDFMRAQQDGMFFPEEYGIVVETGEGEPSAEVRARMEADYGFDHLAMVDVPNAEAAREVANQLSVRTGEWKETPEDPAG
tara:strand:+ start:43181 stop:46342 length:3162 start_codon:yes stop_codon:yes gene_type:complete